jgi:hypothetical protein
VLPIKAKEALAATLKLAYLAEYTVPGKLALYARDWFYLPITEKKEALDHLREGFSMWNELIMSMASASAIAFECGLSEAEFDEMSLQSRNDAKVKFYHLVEQGEAAEFEEEEEDPPANPSEGS